MYWWLWNTGSFTHQTQLVLHQFRLIFGNQMEGKEPTSAIGGLGNFILGLCLTQEASWLFCQNQERWICRKWYRGCGGVAMTAIEQGFKAAAHSLLLQRWLASYLMVSIAVFTDVSYHGGTPRPAVHYIYSSEFDLSSSGWWPWCWPPPKISRFNNEAVL